MQTTETRDPKPAPKQASAPVPKEKTMLDAQAANLQKLKAKKRKGVIEKVARRALGEAIRPQSGMRL